MRDKSFRMFTLLLPASMGACAPEADWSTPFVADDTGTGPTGDADTGGTDPVVEDLDEDGYSAEDGDCDDGDASVHPGATETCNGIDDNCDDSIDEDVGELYYADADGDGFGDPDSELRSCDQPDDWVTNGDDCDDDAASVHPGAEETANDLDDNCDDQIDEGLPTFSVEVVWDEGGVTVTIDGDASGWDFGMAETGPGSTGWFGESCIPGEEPWGYDDHGRDICHPISATKGFIPSVYPEIDLVSQLSTLFNQEIGESGDLTYVLFATDSSDCWVWGNAVDYYADFGCTAY